MRAVGPPSREVRQLRRPTPRCPGVHRVPTWHGG